MVQAPEQVPDLEEAEEAEEASRRRKPGIIVAATGGAAWITMAILGLTVLRPEMAMVRQMAARVASGIPALSPRDFGLAPALPSPASSASAGQAPAPAGWWRYTDPTGFSVNLPDGWTRSYRSANQVQFTSPSRPGATIVIAYSTSPEPDQYADWEGQSAWKAETDPSYVRLHIQQVYYRGYNCADWEFLDDDQGVQTHFLDQGFISAPGRQAYSIELAAPATTWLAAKNAYWNELLTSFVPVSSGTVSAPPTAGVPASNRTTTTPGTHTRTSKPASHSTRAPATGTHASPTPVPTTLPTSIPTSVPTSIPTSVPTSIPTSVIPTSIPASLIPTSLPTSISTSYPAVP